MEETFKIVEVLLRQQAATLVSTHCQSRRQ